MYITMLKMKNIYDYHSNTINHLEIIVTKTLQRVEVYIYEQYLL